MKKRKTGNSHIETDKPGITVQRDTRYKLSSTKTNVELREASSKDAYEGINTILEAINNLQFSCYLESVSEIAEGILAEHALPYQGTLREGQYVWDQNGEWEYLPYRTHIDRSDLKSCGTLPAFVRSRGFGSFSRPILAAELIELIDKLRHAESQLAGEENAPQISQAELIQLFRSSNENAIRLGRKLEQLAHISREESDNAQRKKGRKQPPAIKSMMRALITRWPNLGPAQLWDQINSQSEHRVGIKSFDHQGDDWIIHRCATDNKMTIVAAPPEDAFTDEEGFVVARNSFARLVREMKKELNQVQG